VSKKKWIIVFSILLTGILLARFVFNETIEPQKSNLEAEENNNQLENLWNLEDLVSISHDGTLVELLQKIEASSSFKINLDISESKKEELNKNFTLVVEMKVYEIIGLASQSMGLNVVISDDLKEVLIHD